MGALRTFVLADATVSALLAESVSTVPASERVYVNAIPRETIAASDVEHPPKMVVLRQAGGIPKLDTLPTENLRINVLAYGEDDHQADRVRRSVMSLFVHASRECVGDVMLHHINPASGPVSLVDPDIVWPAVSQAFTLQAGTD